MVRDSLLLKALRGENISRPPVWFMRQAGRYQASYRKLRQKISLEEMFHSERYIVEVTKLPVEELGVDAAIVFSDILLPFEALGCSVTYDGGPKVIPGGLPFKNPSFDFLQEKFGFLTQSLQTLKRELTVPLIGFCGAPFTLASYLLEKEQHHLMKETKRHLYQEPVKFHELLSLLTDLVIAYAVLQIKAGCDVIQVFDSWAGVLDEEGFKTCSSFYLKKIVKAIQKLGVPSIVFCRGACSFVQELVDVAPTAISFDWQRPLTYLKKEVPASIALQGNLDPDILKAPLPFLEERLCQLLQSMQGEKRFIFNLGHGVSPDISEEAVKHAVNYIKAFPCH
ncbi:MAG: uroporphyrinogen decarboxylase [Chlamydiae bacterium]|nr:uroporphyrinogen decarboxylase [Chlamydiota bacterium]